MERNSNVSVRTCHVHYLAYLVEFLDFSETLVRKENQVIVFAPN